jgi:hypothetical protein
MKTDLNNTSLIMAIVAGVMTIIKSIIAIIVKLKKKKSEKIKKDEHSQPDAISSKPHKIVVIEEHETKTKKTTIITF